MFNNYLILKENNNITLYLFINNFKSFKKYYRYFKKKDSKKLIKKINSYLKYNKQIFNGNKVTIVVEGVITNHFYL